MHNHYQAWLSSFILSLHLFPSLALFSILILSLCCLLLYYVRTSLSHCVISGVQILPCRPAIHSKVYYYCIYWSLRGNAWIVPWNMSWPLPFMCFPVHVTYKSSYHPVLHNMWEVFILTGTDIVLYCYFYITYQWSKQGSWLKKLYFWLIFGRCPVQILALTPAILIGFLWVFFFWADVTIVPKLGHEHIIQTFSFHYSPQILQFNMSLIYWQHK
jgi:hypothetical protein